MPLGPFDPIPIGEKVRRSHVNDLRAAMTGVQDAYDVAVADGFTGTRGEFLQGLIGPPGPPGPVPIDEVATTADLATIVNPAIDDVYTVADTGHAHRWSGTDWIDIGQWRGEVGPAIGGLLTAADQVVASNASGNAVAVSSPYVYAEARGVVMNSSAAATTNADILNALLLAGKSVLLPPGICWYDDTLTPKGAGGIIGAGRTLTTLRYTGAGNGMSVLAANGGSYRAVFQGFKLQFDGSGSGHGIYADAFRYGMMRDVYVSGFLTDGVHMTQSWTSRYEHVECDRNGRYGWWFEDEANALVLNGCIGSVNGLDGFYIGRNARIELIQPQMEANGRRGMTVAGAMSVTVIDPYVEHQNPEFWGLDDEIPGYSAQSPRYPIYVTSAADGTLTKYVDIHGGMMEGATGSGTTVTASPIYAENCLNLTFAPGYLSQNYTEGPIIRSTVRRYRGPDQTQVGALDRTPAAMSSILSMTHNYSKGGIPVDRRGLVGHTEGFANLLVNGGFDQEVVGTTTAPKGWTNGSGSTLGAVSYEAGTDGGVRLVFAGTGGATQPIIHQIVTGPGVGAAAKAGVAILGFDVVVPTSNVRNQAKVAVVCEDSGGSSVGGGLASWIVPKSDTETHYELVVPVPAATKQIRVRAQAADFSTSTDTIKLDRMMLTPGETPKGYSPKPIAAPSAPAAIADTSGATLTDLETEVNEMKAALRSAGIIGG